MPEKTFISRRRDVMAFTLVLCAAITIACASEAVAQDIKGANLCPLPATSEEILRRRLAITQYVEHRKFGSLAAWAMRAGHEALLDHWAKGRKGAADHSQGITQFSLAPLTQWLALGRSSPVEAIRDTTAGTIDAKAGHKHQKAVETPQGRKFVELDLPADGHVAVAQTEVLRHVVLPSMLTHGRYKEALELFPLSQYPAEGLLHIDFLVNTGELDQAIELYRKRSELHKLLGGKTALAIAHGLLRAGELERAAAFLDAELRRIREYFEANPSRAKGAWYWQEPVLQLLSRLGRTDWEPPDPLPESSKLGAVASLISALRLAGRGEEAERFRKRAHQRLEEEAADLKQRQATGKPPRLEHMFVAIPSPGTFDLFIELEHAHALLIKGDLENAEKIVRPVQVDRHARFSRAAMLENLATYARHQRLWSKAEVLLTVATSEQLLPQHWVPGIWLAAARDAQQAGETELAIRWVRISGTAFCKLDPDSLERHVGLPVGHRGNLKPFVLPFLDSLYVLTAVREGRLPTHAK